MELIDGLQKHSSGQSKVGVFSISHTSFILSLSPDVFSIRNKAAMFSVLDRLRKQSSDSIILLNCVFRAW